MDSKEEEKLFFEALDNLKKPEWFRTCFFNNSRILTSRIPGRLAPFFLAIQDEPDFFLEFCRATRVVRIPTAWFQFAAEKNRLQTFQALLKFQVWQPEEIVEILSQNKPYSPEILKLLLAYKSFTWSFHRITLVFSRGHRENHRRIFQDSNFQVAYRQLQGQTLYAHISQQAENLFGKEAAKAILNKTLHLHSTLLVAEETLQDLTLFRPKL